MKTKQAESTTSKIFCKNEKSLSEEVLPTMPKSQNTGVFLDGVQDRKNPSRVKVCTGTSCLLSGSIRERQNLKRAGHDCGTARCLGHCDKSPVNLDEFTLEHSNNHTQVRCMAPHPIVSKHILSHDVVKLDDALKAGVYSSIPRALSHTPTELVDKIIESGLRGRDGRGTGIRWQNVAKQSAPKKFVITNGDEGAPGSFLDRVLMEGDPHTIIEGMILCGYATGADEGIIFTRSECPQAVAVMNGALDSAVTAGYLGSDILGSGFDFNIRLYLGTSAYLCGDEDALIQSIESSVGPKKTESLSRTGTGLYGKPTVVNHVETLASIPFIIENGPLGFHNMGIHSSFGTKAVCLNAGFENPGIVEVEYGTTIREIVEESAGGGRDNVPLAAVLIGGPMGSVILPKDWDLPLCVDVLDLHGINMGHGGFIAIPETADFRELLEHLIDFSIYQCCGQCASHHRGTKMLRSALRQSSSQQDFQDMVNAIESGSIGSEEIWLPDAIKTIIREFGNRIF